MLRNDNDERGAIIVFFALILVMLFGLMALAVDTANAYSQRRSSQSAADVSAVAGALQTIDYSGTKNQAVTDLIDKTMEIATSNLGNSLDWENCQDPDSLTENGTDYFASDDDQYTECISWSSNFAEVRVKLPDRQIDTFFARIIGIDTIKVGAFAEVGQLTGGGGGVLPFGILGGGSDGLVCLKTGPKFPDECDPNVSGNFHFMDFRIYGNSAMGTTSSGCTGGTVTTLKENISHGVDHDLAAAPSTPTDHSGIDNDPNIIEDNEQCPDSSKDVQAALTETGNKQKVLIDGFVDGVGSWPGRLTLGSGSKYSYQGVDVDDVALWEYLLDDIDPATPGVQPNPCAGITDSGVLATCVTTNTGTVLFDDSIASSPRLAMVPELWQTSWPSGTKLVSFKSFKFVYIQTLYGNCKNSGKCSSVYAPNEIYNDTSADPVVVTGIVLNDNILSPTVQASFGAPTVSSYAITR